MTKPTVSQLTPPERKRFSAGMETLAKNRIVTDEVLRERANLRHSKQVIADGMMTMLETANVLLDIKVNHLYREDFGTWTKFCRLGAKRSRQSADGLVMEARKAAKFPTDTLELFVGDSTDGKPNPSHRQLAAAARVRPEHAEAWRAETRATGNTSPAALDQLTRELEAADVDEAEESDEAPHVPKRPSGLIQAVKRHVTILRALFASANDPECNAALDLLEARALLVQEPTAGTESTAAATGKGPSRSV